MTEFWDDFPAIKADLEQVSGLMGDAVHSDNPVIGEAAEAIFGGDGKLLRPGFLLAAARFGPKFQIKKSRSLAAALELLHVATLIHDDVIDDSPLRRGLPTTQLRYGKKDAVLIGDFLLSRCFLLAGQYTTPKNAMLLARAISVICSMEIEQNLDRYRADRSIRRYLRKIMGKTALLFALAGHIGAAEAKAAPAVVARLRRAGYDIGMAFQIIDDILDYEADQALIGKPVGSDLRDGLSTLPLLCALANDDGGLAAAVVFDAFKKADTGVLVAMVRERGGLEAARVYARLYTDRARREIAGLPAGEYRDLLKALTDKLLTRRY